MKRVHADPRTGQRPDYAQRSEDLAREVLRDLKCTEKAEIMCCWGSHDMRAPQALRVPMVRIVFEGKTEMAWDPSLCKLSPVTTSAAFSIALVNFADGSIYNDDRMKYEIRSQVEGYLGQFTLLPGISEPKHFRLTEHDYA